MFVTTQVYGVVRVLVDVSVIVVNSSVFFVAHVHTLMVVVEKVLVVMVLVLLTVANSVL